MKKSKLWLRSLAAAGLSMSVFLSTLGSVPVAATGVTAIENTVKNDDQINADDQTTVDSDEAVKNDVNEVKYSFFDP